MFININDDVLAEIFTYLSTTEAVRLSLTSKRIHPLAIRQVYHTVIIRHLKQVKAVCWMLLRENAHRLTYVREFSVHSAALSAVEQDHLSQIVEVLGHPFASRIRCLKLGMIERMVKREPRLIGIVSALPQLVRLELSHAGKDSLLMLQGLHT
ncbi:uncharacterized protein LAESUDRAFT_662430, partial [Laetiporus sulphureus 93-53]